MRSLKEYAYLCIPNIYQMKCRADRLLKSFNRNTSAEETRPYEFEVNKIREICSFRGVGLNELGFGYYEMRSGSKIVRFHRCMVFDVEGAFSYLATGNKYITYQMIKNSGYSCIPEHALFSYQSTKSAKEYFLSSNKPSVVKPCSGTSGGKGVTASITNLKELNRAIRHALAFDKNFIIESHIEGDHYRLLFLNGVLLDAVQRLPPYIVGDGSGCIGHLLKLENQKRAADKSEYRLWPITIDNDLRHTLASKGYSLDYVPTKNEKVYLKAIVNLSAGGSIRNVNDYICQGIVGDCSRIVNSLGVVFSGVDIICKDITKNIFVINEINTSPVIELHYKDKQYKREKDIFEVVFNVLFPI